MPLAPMLEPAVKLTSAALAGGIVAGVVLSRWQRACGWVCSLALAGALAGSGWIGSMAWESGAVGIQFGSESAYPISLHFSRLNMIFIWLVLGLGLLATVYSVRYLEHASQAPGTPRSAALRYYPVLMVFLASMVAVVCLPNLVAFFVAWSVMSLAGLALIVHEYHKPGVLRAGLKFAAFTLVGNAAIFAAIMLYHSATGTYSVSNQGALPVLLRHGLGSPTAHLIFGLFAFGFLTKLGIYPMGDWLPDAHPAAPSPVSALLSGVMIKLAAYDIAHMMIRTTDAPAGAMMAWGMVLAALGGVSVLLGGSAAAANNDTKRLLAYSSVAQSGYILMCLGLSMAFAPVNQTLALLAFVAGIVFVIADAMHKSLLFLTAGSVLHATGTRDLVQLGGLGDRMPTTTGAAIAGGLSVGGIPLSAGFVGKWLLFQTALLGAAVSPVVAVYLLVIVVGSILSLAYALKYVGAAYLGAPAGPVPGEAHEVPASMRLPQIVLAIGAVAAGLWPALIVRPALQAWGYLGEAASPLASVHAGELLVPLGSSGMVGGFVSPVVLVLVTIAGLIALGLSRLGGVPTREVPSWQSGLALPLAHTRLPASGWYWPFTPILRAVYREIPFPWLSAPVPVESEASEGS